MDRKMRVALGLTALAVGLVVATGQAQDKKDQLKMQEATSKAEKYQSAATISFGAELGLAFPSLTSLGARIEQARLAADPVCLAMAAQELAIAEAVAKKKAAITADAIMQEAYDLAKLRKDSKELQAVALIVTGGRRAELEQLASAAAKAEEERLAADKAGERSKAIRRDLIVRNDTGNHLHIYYNGNEVGIVGVHQTRRFHIHDDHGDEHFTLDARGHNGYYRHVHRDANYRDFYWTLN
jgi:hypothetical protein